MPLLLAAAMAVAYLALVEVHEPPQTGLGQRRPWQGAFPSSFGSLVRAHLGNLHEFPNHGPRIRDMSGEYAPVGYYAWTGTWLERTAM